MEAIGNEEVLSQGSKAVNKNISDILKRYGLSDDAFSIYGYDVSLAVLERKGINKVDKDRIEELRPFIESREIVKSARSFKDANNKILDAVVKNTRADSHFLERIHVDHPASGYVVDFTQPITLYREVIDELSFGLEKFTYERDKNGKYSSISFDALESGEIVSILNSPFIEHLLQRFTHYYSRIGTKDISEDDLMVIKGRYEIA